VFFVKVDIAFCKSSCRYVDITFNMLAIFLY